MLWMDIRPMLIHAQIREALEKISVSPVNTKITFVCYKILVIFEILAYIPIWSGGRYIIFSHNK